MIYAYDQVYLEKARTVLARMLDFAVYDLNYDLTEFFRMFIVSGLAERFEKGESGIIAGRSGVELAYDVLENCQIDKERIKPRYTSNRSKEYWTGWALAYYQWKTALSFKNIIQYVPIKEICILYEPYHEMDIRRFVERMNEIYKRLKQDTNLKIQRTRMGFSQKEVAKRSGVPLRTIQQYEQRQKNINKASAEYIIALSRVLFCRPDELLEITE
jgi:DNA-binding transcriptional regulator YiaG